LLCCCAQARQDPASSSRVRYDGPGGARVYTRGPPSQQQSNSLTHIHCVSLTCLTHLLLLSLIPSSRLPACCHHPTQHTRSLKHFHLITPNYPTSIPPSHTPLAPPGLPLSFPHTAEHPHSHNPHTIHTHSQNVRNLRIHQLPRREGQKVHSRHPR
jgi:hypothetical protein